MKAITIHQPWASLIVTQDKIFETRGWTHRYRGLIAIHAGRTWDERTKVWTQVQVAKHGLQLPETLPLGAVLCVCELKGVYRTEQLVLKIGTKEAALGNYEAGRYAWHLIVREIFDPPIFTSGKQGLWEWNPTRVNVTAESSYARI